MRSFEWCVALTTEAHKEHQTLVEFYIQIIFIL